MIASSASGVRNQPVLGRGDDAGRVRREPVQLADDQARGKRITVQRLVGQELRRVGGRERRACRQRMPHQPPPRRAQGVLGCTPPRARPVERRRDEDEESCSRTITISAAAAPSATPPPIVQRSRTRSHTKRQAATAKAWQACAIGAPRTCRRSAASEPDGERRGQRAAAEAEAVRHRQAQHHRQPAVDGRAEGHGADVG